MTDKVDLLVRGTLVNVCSGTLEDTAIAIDSGEIVALEERPADRELVANYVAPGLIDAHTHVEFSMVTLPRFGDAILPKGITGVVHDPHEVANVLGESGVRDFIRDAAYTPLKAYMTVPSSVPATDFQDAGAFVDTENVDSLLETDDAIALGEVMNTHAVIDGDASVHAKIRAARDRGLVVDGHVPGVSGGDLQELSRHLDTDHESVTLEAAREKVQAGFRVYIREGSASKNLEEIIDLVGDVDTRRLSLCTDGTNIAYTMEEGSVNVAVQKAIESGVDPVTAVQMATINTAEAYGLPSGRIVPGAPADLVLLSDLEAWSVENVIVDGILNPTADRADTTESAVATDTVQFSPVSAADLAIERIPTAGTARVRVVKPVGDFQTEREFATVPVVSPGFPDVKGVLGADIEADVLPLAVIERHGGPGTIGCGFVTNLGLTRGAIGTTVAHDAHNCVVAGTNHEMMAHVANHLRDVGGGIAVYDPETDEYTTLRLPHAGLVADAPLEKVKSDFRDVEAAARDIGLTVPGGIMEVTFLPLEVIPTYRLTNKGLVDAETAEYLDVVVE